MSFLIDGYHDLSFLCIIVMAYFGDGQTVSGDGWSL